MFLEPKPHQASGGRPESTLIALNSPLAHDFIVVGIIILAPIVRQAEPSVWQHGRVDCRRTAGC